MPIKSRENGFSLIEVIISMFIMVIVSIVTLPFLLGANRLSDLRNVTREMVASLSEAQAQAANGTQGSAWGVYFSNSTNTAPFYASYTGSSYASGTVVDYHRLPASVSYTAAAGGTVDINFAVLSGAVSRSSTIQLFVTAQPTTTSSISVASSGMVRYVLP